MIIYCLKIFNVISVLLFLVLTSLSFAQSNGTASDTLATASGLKYVILGRGNGAKADTGMEVEINYNWYLTNGRLIGSSFKTGHPYDFVLGKGKVIKGWDEGISYMHAGDHFKFIIPPQLGYGKKGAGDVIPPNAALIYDTYLISVGKAKEQFIDTLFNLTLKKEWTLQSLSAVDYFKLKETNIILKKTSLTFSALSFC